MLTLYMARRGNGIDHMTITSEYSSTKYSDTGVRMKITR